jgi:CDP-diacylglycerol--glycerol-3-phosphate 3-phosphatidyltransferase
MAGLYWSPETPSTPFSPVVDPSTALYDRDMSIANLITLARGIAIVPIVVLLASGHRWAAWWMFGFACSTDLIDGLVARARNEVTRLGKALDPLVDKALYLSILFALFVIGDIPLWALVLFLVPQLTLALGALLLRVRRDAVQGARLLGKAAAGLSFIAIAFLIVKWPGGREIFYAAIALTYVATTDYMVSGSKLKGNTQE